MDRKTFELDQGEYDALVALNTPGAGTTIQMDLDKGQNIIETKSVQTLVNDWWKVTAEKYGVRRDTVKHRPDLGPRCFDAHIALRASQRQYLKAEFGSGGMAYTYCNDGPPVACGDKVLVSGRGGKGHRTVTVVEIMPDRPTDLPSHVEIKAIIGPAPPPEGDEGKLL